MSFWYSTRVSQTCGTYLPWGLPTRQAGPTTEPTEQTGFNSYKNGACRRVEPATWPSTAYFQRNRTNTPAAFLFSKAALRVLSYQARTNTLEIQLGLGLAGTRPPFFCFFCMPDGLSEWASRPASAALLGWADSTVFSFPFYFLL